MRMVHKGWWLLGLVLLVAACSRTQPQRPVWRNGHSVSEPDSSLMQLLELNRHLADAADTELALLADSLGGYSQLPCGAWIMLRRTDAADTLMPQPEQTWHVAMQVRTLRGGLLSDEQRMVRIAHHELPEAAEEAVALMHAGDSARVLAPWYTAYGLSGTETVPPYSNVQMTICLQR